MNLSKETIEFFFKHAWIEAEKSQCLKKKVGAVLVDLDLGIVVGSGCGGAKVPCLECVRKVYDWQQDGCWSVHSEMRVLFDYFEQYGYEEDLSRCVMVVTHGPCDACAKLVNLFGIPTIWYDVEYHNNYSKWEGKVKILQKEALENGINLP